MKIKNQDICAAAIIAVLYVVLHILNIGCPIKFITGISCAGCGMTRAWFSVLKLDFIQAFYYHPLFWTVPFGGIYAFVWQYKLGNRLCTNAPRYGMTFQENGATVF